MVENIVVIAVSLLSIFLPGAILILISKSKSELGSLNFSILATISIGANYAINYALNKLDIYLPQVYIFSFYLVLFLIILIFKKSTKFLKFTTPEILIPFITALFSIAIFKKSYAGFAWLLPNADGFAHNFYTSRILTESSVLNQDVLVQSPLVHNAPNFENFYFYPLAWHAELAQIANVTKVSVPTVTLTATIFISSILLGIGLFALSKQLFDHWKVIGSIASLLSLTIPIFPGVPISWGAIPVIIAVSMLPGILASTIAWFHEKEILNLSFIFLVLANFSLFFIHSSEAVFTGLFFFILLLIKIYNLKIRVNFSIREFFYVLIATIGILAIFYLTKGAISGQTNALQSQLGGAGRTFEESIGSFFTLSIRVPQSQWLFGLLSLIGFASATSRVKTPTYYLLIGQSLLIYLLSGANQWPLSELRILTLPWYGSYERTAWNIVPIVLIFAAIPLAEFGQAKQKNYRKNLLLLCSTLLIILQIKIGLEDSLTQYRTAVIENQIAGPGSATLFKKLRSDYPENVIWLTERGDGSAYANFYDGINVTNGAFDSAGNPSAEAAKLLEDLNVCEVNNLKYIDDNNIVGVILGTRRYAWENPRWNEDLIYSLKGFKLVGESEDLFALQIDMKNC